MKNEKMAALFAAFLMMQPAFSQDESQNIDWKWNYSATEDGFIDLVDAKSIGFQETNTPNYYGGVLEVELPQGLSFKQNDAPVFLFAHPDDANYFQVNTIGKVAVLSLKSAEMPQAPQSPIKVSLNKKAIKGKLKGMNTEYQLTFSSVDVVREFKSPVTGRTYSLVFNDEFNDRTIDSTRWDLRSRRQPFTRRGEYKGSPYYTLCHDDWTKEQDGSLRLEVSKYPTQQNVIMTGGILSLGRFMTRYGYYETKANFKDCKGEGYWPAFWLHFDEADKYGDGCEIDIFEYIPKDQQMFHTLHWYKKDPLVEKKKEVQHAAKSYDVNKKKNEHRSSTKFYTLKDAMTKDHVIALEWTPDELIFYVDGEVVRRVNKSEDPKMVPSAYQMVYFSCSGGEWGGNVMKNNAPAYVYFDYCRCYQESTQDAVYTVQGESKKVPAADRKGKL